MSFLRIIKGLHVQALYKENGDIAEVQAIIALLEPQLLGFWAVIVREALEDLLERLQALDDQLPTSAVDVLVIEDKRRDDLKEELLLAFFLLIESRVVQPPSRGLQRALREGIAELLTDGARSVGATFPTATAAGTLLPPVAEADILMLLRGHLQRSKPELLIHLEDFLENRLAREKIQTVAVEGSISSLNEWIDKARKILSITGETFIPQVVDMWAYRWYSIGAFTGAKTLGVKALRLQNPLDRKTTPFCRWVHGRLISIERAESQIEEYAKAVGKGDLDAAMAAWPMTRFKSSAGINDFAHRFEELGLPPYHFYCRTVAVPVTV